MSYREKRRAKRRHEKRRYTPKRKPFEGVRVIERERRQSWIDRILQRIARFFWR